MGLLLAEIGKPFIPGWNTAGAALHPFIGEIVLIVTIVAVLIVPFFIKRSNAASGMVALLGVVAALVIMLCVHPARASSMGEQFRGLLVSDPVAVLWKGLLLVFTAGVILMWFSTTSATMHEGDGPEFFTLLLGATLGMSLMVSTSNLLMIFMSVEMASLPSYVLAGFRKTNRVGAEASLKYVLFGAATSSIMVFGLSYLYGLYGTLQMEELARQMTATTGGSALLVVAMAGLIIGVGFKISAVPFHFWCPDVFEGASIDVSAFLSVASKGAGLILLMRVLMIVADAVHYQASGVTTGLAAVIGTLGAITATVGNTAAFVQNNIKRLLAYSSIAHAGYMLCALSLLVKSDSSAAGFLPASPVAQAILIYLATYVFMNLGAFTVAGVILRQTGSEDIRDYAALGRRSPILAGAMFCCLVSLIGLPPFAGFMAKLNVLWVLFQNGSWWWILIVVIGLNTILSAFYYFRVIKAMYLTDGPGEPFFGHPLGTAMAAGCAAVLFAMLIGFGPMSKYTGRFSQFSGIPTSGKAAMATAEQQQVRSVTVAARKE